MSKTVAIGVIGDFNAKNPTHIATNDAVQHAAATLGRVFESVWLPTDQLQTYDNVCGLLCSPGSPYRSLEGAIAGIRYARENEIPLIGTCGGFQHLILEYARNVMGFSGAAHAESDPSASCLFVIPLSCSLAGKTMEVAIKAGSAAAAAYKASKSPEAYYCNFGLNPEYEHALESSGLEITGTDEDGEVRIVELPSHPFFLGTLFVPQVRSSMSNPHPLILEFCRACILNNQGF